MMRSNVLVVIASAILVACSSGELIEQPKELPENLPNLVKLDVQWARTLGKEHAPKAFGQRVPAVFEDRAFVALADGSIFKLDLQGDSDLLGRHQFSVTAPLGIDTDDMVVLDSQGQVTVYDHQFTKKWDLSLNAISVEAPLLTDSRLFVQTIDGRVNAIERITGRLLWVYQDAEPDLTLTGTSTPVLIETDSGQAIVTGLANGKIIALSVFDGSVIWEYRIAKASGRTDVSRLVDVDAKVTDLEDRLLVSGYQGDLIVVDSRTGQVLQAKEFSSYRSVLAYEGVWYGIDAQSHIVALNPLTLEVLWTNTDFEYRQLSEIVALDGYLAMNDVEGYLHVVSAATGQWLGSRQIDWRGAKTDPVLFGNGVLMQGHSTRVKLVEIIEY